MNSSDLFEVRQATPEDLQRTLSWLKSDAPFDPEGSFLSNAENIGRHPKDLTVAVEKSTGEPVGFCAANREHWNKMDIVSVRKVRRGEGIGQLLTNEYLLEAARSQSIGVWGECRPPSSKSFWLMMGFTPIPKDLCRGGDVADRVASTFAGRNELSSDIVAPIRIELMRPHLGDSPIREFESVAYQVDGAWELHDWFACCCPDGDVVARISLDGSIVSKDKIKRLADVGGERNFPFARLRCLWP